MTIPKRVALLLTALLFAAGTSNCSSPDKADDAADRPSPSFCTTYESEVQRTGEANKAGVGDIQAAHNMAKMYRNIGNAAPDDATALKKSLHKLFLLYGKAANTDGQLYGQDVKALEAAEEVVADYHGSHCQTTVTVPTV